MNYDLRKKIGEDSVTVEMWGEKRTKKRRVLGKPVIKSFVVYAFNMFDDTFKGVGGAAFPDDDCVDIYPDLAVETAEEYYERISRLKEELEKDIANPDLLDRYYPAHTDNIEPEFYRRMGRILRYLAVKKDFESSKSCEEFVKKFVPAWEKDVNLEEVRHLMDFENVDLSKYGNNNYGQRFKLLFEGYTEMRAFLTRMHHGRGKQVLGECFAWLYPAFKDPRLVEAHAAAAKLITQLFVFELESNRTEYEEAGIDYSKYDKTADEDRACFELFKQFPKLSDKQVREMAGSIYQSYFKGARLEDFVKEKLDKGSGY
jgi:hypothetical protein